MQHSSHLTGRAARPVTFRQFSRKGWSLFACLHREVRVGMLSAATLLTAAPCLASHSATLKPSHAEEPLAADTVRLGEANVTASRAPLAADVAARQVVTLTRSDLEAAGVSTVNDLLKLSATVDVRQRGAFGMQTDISIDGGTFDQITLLVNGIPVVNPQTGHNAADFPLNLSDVDRVEILEGAASRVLGSQAFSGAVNIVTRRTTQSAPLEVQLEGGSYATLRGEASTAWTWGQGWEGTASASWQRSDGAVPNSAFSGGKAFATLGRTMPAYRVQLQAGATVNDFGANTFYSAAYPNQWEATRRYLLSAHAETSGRVHLSASASWLRSTDHFQLTRHSTVGENFHRGDVFNLSANAWTQWCGGRTAVGAELRQEDIYSTNLGRPLTEEQYVHIRGEAGRYYTRRDARTNMSYYLEHNVVWRWFTLSAGVMAERNDAIDGRFRFYPGVDLSYRPSAAWRLYASWNRSLRLPSFTDLWYKSPTQEGNVGLRPEENSAWRVGADFTSRPVTLRFKARYQRGTHMIDWVMYSADDIYHATAFSLDNYGLGADATLHLTEMLGSRQPLTRLTLSYAWTGQHRRAGEPYFKSNYALEYLRHKLVARLQHRIWCSLTAEWTCRVQQREGHYLLYQNGLATAELRPYGTHALLDLAVRWTRPRYTLYVEGTNLTNTSYFDLANVRQPGLLVMGGCKVRL